MFFRLADPQGALAVRVGYNSKEIYSAKLFIWGIEILSSLHPVQMDLDGFLHPLQYFFPGISGGDTSGKVRAISRIIAIGFFNYY
jgi:hypothetical protein